MGGERADRALILIWRWESGFACYNVDVEREWEQCSKAVYILCLLLLLSLIRHNHCILEIVTEMFSLSLSFSFSLYYCQPQWHEITLWKFFLGAVLLQRSSVINRIVVYKLKESILKKDFLMDMNLVIFVKLSNL